MSYVFMIHKVTWYSAPINHERFKQEFKSRYWLGNQRRSIGNIQPTNPSEGRLFWAILHPIKVCKLIKNYQMISNFNITLQILYVLVLIHLFIKSIIQAMIIGSDKERIKYFDSMYYPNVFGFASRPHLFNHLFLGYSVFYLVVKLIRIRNIIDLSLENAYEYTSLKVAQINLTYLASFNLTPKEWIGLLKYMTEHEKIHLNEVVKMNHEGSNNLVRQILPHLTDKDAIFYVNPIDFEKCYADSILSNYNQRITRFKSWHFALPIDRMSVSSLGETLFISMLGASLVVIGYVLIVIGIIYLELRQEFQADYSASLKELIYVIPFHWSKFLHLIRSFELIISMSSQVFVNYDLICACLDIHINAQRAQKMVLIFKNHIRFARNQAKINIQNLKLKGKPHKSQSFILKEKRKKLKSNLSFHQGHNVYSGYNAKVRNDVASTRLLYYEFLNSRKYHTEYFNMYVLGAGMCIAYIIGVLISQPLSTESYMLMVALMSGVGPIVTILLYCARMERTVSF